MQRPLLIALAAPLLFACGEEILERPMVQVVVDTVVLEPYQPKREYVGRLQARDDVSIQAMVPGYVVSRDFREGELVQEGEVLYTLDSSEYDAATPQLNTCPGNSRRRR